MIRKGGRQFVHLSHSLSASARTMQGVNTEEGAKPGNCAPCFLQTAQHPASGMQELIGNRWEVGEFACADSCKTHIGEVRQNLPKRMSRFFYICANRRRNATIEPSPMATSDNTPGSGTGGVNGSGPLIPIYCCGRPSPCGTCVPGTGV